jgi:hypothetical protein
MKAVKLIAILIVMLIASMVAAQEVRTDYTEAYRWHGFSLYDDSYVHPGTKVTVREIDIGAVAHMDDAEADDLEYWDTSLAYQLPQIAGLEWRAAYNYLILPNQDIQEIAFTARIPGTISPRYTISHIIPDNQHTGQIHTIGVDFPLGDPNVIAADLFAEVEYNDGINILGDTPIRDWSHCTVGLVLSVPARGFTLCPGVFYQHTFNEAVCDDKNEVWYAVGAKYQF